MNSTLIKFQQNRKIIQITKGKLTADMIIVSLCSGTSICDQIFDTFIPFLLSRIILLEMKKKTKTKKNSFSIATILQIQPMPMGNYWTNYVHQLKNEKNAGNC